MIVFENQGELDVRAFTTFGISAKISSSAIGQFGTGLKYAISIILRNAGTIEIYSGEEKFKFSLKRESFRESEFDFIYVNGQALPFTTHLGHMWKVWQAYRELYSNCKDEGGQVYITDDIIKGKKGVTYITVCLPELENCFYNHDLYFLNKPERSLLFANKEVEIYDGSSKNLFYKGVLVPTEYSRNFDFTYNLLSSKVKLTEDRTLCNFYECLNIISQAIAEDCRSEYVISRFLTAHTDETLADFCDYFKFSTAFNKTLEDISKNKLGKINNSAYQYFLKLNRNVTSIEISKIDQSLFNEACDIARSLGFDISPYQVVFVTSLGEGIIAQAVPKINRIYFAPTAFRNKEDLIATIIEEVIHCRDGLIDNSRAMQNYLFSLVVKFGLMATK